MFNRKEKKHDYSILMVCMGNICRSPTAEAVLKNKVQFSDLNVRIDSAGTLGLHKGNKPDPRSVQVGEQAGYSFKGIRSRPVEDSDFETFDLVLAMDQDNIRELLIRCPQEYKHKVKLLLSFANSDKANEFESEVPDPYYGGGRGFELVLTLVEQGCNGLITTLESSGIEANTRQD